MSRGICVLEAISSGDVSEPIVSCPYVRNGHITVRIQHTLTDCGSARGAIAAVRGLGNQHWLNAVFIGAFVVRIVVGESSERVRGFWDVSDEGGAHGLVNRSGEVFGAAVGVVAVNRLPTDKEFAIADEVF